MNNFIKLTKKDKNSSKTIEYLVNINEISLIKSETVERISSLIYPDDNTGTMIQFKNGTVIYVDEVLEDIL